MTDRLSLLLPLNDDWFCVCDRDVIHAATVGQALRRQQKPPSRRRKTYDTLCGLRAVGYAVEAVSETTGDLLGYSLMAWPPPDRFDGHRRCTDCWTRTGRPRPHPTFRQLRTTEAA